MYSLWSRLTSLSTAMESAVVHVQSRTVCVTGAGGYLASWLVKLLLDNGYIVHGTVRDPGDAKNAHLNKLENANDHLKLFKADLLDHDSVASAIAGCEGVFHVASPVPTAKAPSPEEDIVALAVNGTLNVLKACSEAKVKRVVVVSSKAAVSMSLNWRTGTVMDEDSWSDPEYCRTEKNWYCLSKALAEREALDYAEKHGLDVVTVCPPLIIGPLLQSTVNASSLVLINILKGARKSIENSFKNFVDVRDVADALLLVYEKPKASGRYICAPHRSSIRNLADLLKSIYPKFKCPKEFIEVEEGSQLSSEKLKRLGWKSRTLKESLIDSVEFYQAAGLLEYN